MDYENAVTTVVAAPAQRMGNIHRSIRYPLYLPVITPQYNSEIKTDY